MIKVKEIFTSIQGEGPYVGYKQLFIRLCGCNLNCAYCDTDFDTKNSKEYSINKLISICNENSDCHSVSLTGGEPLLHKNIIKELGQANIKLPIYLETNGTLSENLADVISYITYIAADIKLPSCTGLKPLWEEHEKFFNIAQNVKSCFAKTVFDTNINDFEIEKTTSICRKYSIPLIIQPKMEGHKLNLDANFIQATLNKFLIQYKDTRLIPQMHKFINVD